MATTPTEQMMALVKIYLDRLHTFPENISPEFEVKFSTKGNSKISKINFNNVIQSLYNYGFKSGDQEQYILRIMTTNVRTEIRGFNNIQNYCISENIPEHLDDSYTFIVKQPALEDQQRQSTIDFPDMNFRVAFNTEETLSKSGETIATLVADWKNQKKYFRHMKRYTFIHKDLPFAVDLSIVKSSTPSRAGVLTIKDSNVFKNPETYEVEIEIRNKMVGVSSKYATADTIIQGLRKTIKYILMGLQESQHPIGLEEIQSVLMGYYKTIGKTPNKNNANNNSSSKTSGKTSGIITPIPHDFVGPSSATLQMENLLNLDGDRGTNIPNIRENYTVTDKADGMRKLLFINEDGRIYLINTNMQVQYTGATSKNRDIFNSLVDGEHVLHDKNGKFLNSYMAFDIYYIDNKNITGYPLTETREKDKTVDNKDKDKNTGEIPYRLNILSSLMKALSNENLSRSHLSVSFSMKRFYSNVFSGAKTILANASNGLYKYNTDGLIFTPANTGVASDKIGYEAPNFKTTWERSFKWKPPEYNTVDFLVSIKKNKTGEFFVGNKFTAGIGMTGAETDIKQYNSMILRVGFDEKKHGYINPCQSIIDDRLPKKEPGFSTDRQSDYKPVQFFPTNPSDDSAGLANFPLTLDKTGELKLFTEEGEEIEDNMIVECRYDIDAEVGWRWIPIRVRYDKTQELRSGVKNFGNAYHVANNNWRSIHYPITEEIIASGIIPDNYMMPENNEIYYNKSNRKSETKALRDFHNLYVKSMLIRNAASKWSGGNGATLIDYAVGKAGDMPKWINSRIRYVLGIDQSRDNIENRMDGACARYLNYSKKYDVMPAVMFLHGNSSVNIRNGNAFSSEKNRAIMKAVFGEGTRDERILGRAPYKNYGIAKAGFNISSVQFALHYMFENTDTMHRFIGNLTECTELGGYFIGTCYDGAAIYNLLRNKERGESMVLYKNQEKIWEITKQYNMTDANIPDSEQSIGLAIDVYQETINKVFREYLVNFTYLIRVMENYGFVLLERAELDEIGFYGKEATGMFGELWRDLYNTQQKSSGSGRRRDLGDTLSMSDEEKTISFLNRYFIFKKIRAVDGADVSKQYKKGLSPEETELAEQILAEMEAEADNSTTKSKKKPSTKKSSTNKPSTKK